MAKLLSEILQSPRYKLLYFIHQKGNLELTEGLKARLQKNLGYQSDGAFHYDWAFLLEHDLIRQDGNNVSITKKGRREFMLVDTLLIAGLVSVLYGTLFLFNQWFATQNLVLYPWLAVLTPWLTGFFPWVVVASLNFYVYRLFRPKMRKDMGSL